MANVFNEWEWQLDLTAAWRSGAVELAGEPFTLLSWEVMAPSWLINDSRVRWGEQAVDFLLVDSSGRLVAAETKRHLGGQIELARACAQVTAIATVLKGSLTDQGLQRVYAAARAGALGRIPLDGPEDVFEHAPALAAHRTTRGPVQPFRRMVLVPAPTVGSNRLSQVADDEFHATLSRSTAKSADRLSNRLGSAFARYGTEVSDAVEVVEVGVPPSSPLRL